MILYVSVTLTDSLYLSKYVFLFMFNHSKNLNTVMICDLGKPATCHTGQFCRIKQNNLIIVMVFFISYQL